MSKQRFVCSFAALLALANAAALAGSGFTYNNESDLPEEADAALLIGPVNTQAYAGYDTEPLRGAIFEKAITEPEGESPSVIAEIGYGPQGSDPRFSPDWTWSSAAFDLQLGTEDNYIATQNISTPGVYSYTYRFSLDAGSTWTLADLDGAGSNTGYDFDPASLGEITVIEAPIAIDFANFKNRTFRQISPAPPTTPISYAGDQRIFGYSLTPETVGSAQVTFPGISPPVIPLDIFAGGFFVLRFLPEQTTESELDDLIPAGLHTFEIFGGLLGSGTGVIDQPAVNRWSNVAFIENFSTFQSPNHTAPLFVDYNTPVIGPEINDGGVFWGVLDPLANLYVAFGNAGFSDPSNFTIAANTLDPARRYEFEITFSVRTLQDVGTDALASARGFAAWDSITRLTFRTAPACAGDADFNGVVNFADITTVLVNFTTDYDASTGAGDADGSGIVNFADVTSVLVNFGSSCL